MCTHIYANTLDSLTHTQNTYISIQKKHIDNKKYTLTSGKKEGKEQKRWLTKTTKNLHGQFTPKESTRTKTIYEPHFTTKKFSTQPTIQSFEEN